MWRECPSGVVWLRSVGEKYWRAFYSLRTDRPSELQNPWGILGGRSQETVNTERRVWVVDVVYKGGGEEMWDTKKKRERNKPVWRWGLDSKITIQSYYTSKNGKMKKSGRRKVKVGQFEGGGSGEGGFGPGVRENTTQSTRWSNQEQGGGVGGRGKMRPEEQPIARMLLCNDFRVGKEKVFALNTRKYNIRRRGLGGWKGGGNFGVDYTKKKNGGPREIALLKT